LYERALSHRTQIDRRDAGPARAERERGTGERSENGEREEEKRAHEVPELPLRHSRARAKNLR
jgi:hypothetical protein